MWVLTGLLTAVLASKLIYDSVVKKEQEELDEGTIGPYGPELLNGVNQIGLKNDYAFALSVIGKNAYPLISIPSNEYGEGTTHFPIVAYSTDPSSNDARVIIFNTPELLGTPMLYDTEKLILNSIKWASKGKEPSNTTIAGFYGDSSINSELVNYLKKQGFQLLEVWRDKGALNDLDVFYFRRLYGITIDDVKSHLSKGKGLVIADGGDSLLGYHGSLFTKLKHEGNQILKSFGLRWTSVKLDIAPLKKGDPIKVDRVVAGKTHAGKAFTIIKSKVKSNNLKSSSKYIRKVKLVATILNSACPESEPTVGEIINFVESLQIPSPTSSNPIQDSWGKTFIDLDGEVTKASMDCFPASKIKAHGSSSYFPGMGFSENSYGPVVNNAELIIKFSAGISSDEPPKDKDSKNFEPCVDVNKILEQPQEPVLIIEPTYFHFYLKSPIWYSTGYYAKPGSVIKVEIVEQVEFVLNLEQKLQIQIGIHTDSLVKHVNSRKKGFERYPMELTLAKDIEHKETEIASPYGGPIYIAAVLHSKIESLKVRVSGGVRLPTFILGSTSLEDWNKEIKAPGTPWAELIAPEHIILTVPSKEIKLNPQDYLTKYVEGLELAYKLGGFKFDPPIRLTYDIQLACDGCAAHAGYPISIKIHPKSWKWEFYESDYCKGMHYVHWHELGHFDQYLPWSMENTGEVTNNLFGIYVREKICNEVELTKNKLSYNKLVNEYKDGGSKFDSPSMRLGVIPYEQLAFKYGWDNFYTKFFEFYKKLKGGKVPTIAPSGLQDRRDLLYVVMSRIANEDLINFFASWKVDVSPNAKACISNLKEKLNNSTLSLEDLVR